eukprot:scaffold41220_cov71-Phaeocystis_antarctica.AAC.1
MDVIVDRDAAALAARSALAESAVGRGWRRRRAYERPSARERGTSLRERRSGGCKRDITHNPSVDTTSKLAHDENCTTSRHPREMSWTWNALDRVYRCPDFRAAAC